jgi:hypothetical protein
MIPQTFSEWKDCIRIDCKINLTQKFAQQRLAVYQDKEHTETKKFILLYGEQHLKNIIQWFNQI